MNKEQLFSIAILFSISICNAQTWILQNSTTTENIKSVNFRLSHQNTMAGWAVGDNNTGLATQDGGTNWYSSIVTNTDNNCVYFTIVDFGHVVGANANLWMTDAGGLWWYQQTSPAVPPVYYGTWFQSQYNGWAVGQNGTIIQTTSQGNSWFSNTSGTTVTLRAIDGIGNFGWTVGDNGTIVNTNSGGASWNIQPSGTVVTLRSVCLVSLDTGWVCGDAGTILYTEDGGANWSTQNSGTTLNLNGISFVDKNHGWAVGDSGKIISTANGGLNWNAEVSGVIQKLNSVHFYDIDSGWAGGNSGIILRYIPAVSSGIQSNSENNYKINVFPSPANDKINITISNRNSLSFKIINALGENIHKGFLGEINNTIDLSEISKGIYSIIIFNDKIFESKSFIKNGNELKNSWWN